MGEEYIRSVNVQASQNPYGNILLLDTMEDLLKWNSEGTGADFAVTKAQNLVFNGDYTLDMITRATNPAANDYVGAYRYFPVRFSEGIRFKCTFSVSNASEVTSVKFVLFQDDGTALKSCGITVDAANSLLKYMNSSGSYVQVSATNYYIGDNQWNFLSFAANFSDTIYTDLVFNNVSFDLSSYAIRSQATGNVQSGYLYIYLTAASDQRPSLYVDDVIVMAT